MSLKKKPYKDGRKFMFMSRRKIQSEDFRKDSGDLVQATIIIASLVVASIVTVGGVSVASQQKAKSTAICINNSTSFAQNGNLGEDCRREAEEVQHSTEETIDEIFGGGNTSAPGNGSNEEEVLECSLDDSSEKEDREAIKKVYLEYLELLVDPNRNEEQDRANLAAELEEIFGSDPLTPDSVLSGDADKEKVKEALEASRKYINIPPIFYWHGGDNEQVAAFSEIMKTSYLLYLGGEIKERFPYLNAENIENVEFEVNEDNFLYYGDVASYRGHFVEGDLKIYINGEELEDYYISEDNKSLHYMQSIGSTETFIKDDDCSWKFSAPILGYVDPDVPDIIL